MQKVLNFHKNQDDYAKMIPPKMDLDAHKRGKDREKDFFKAKKKSKFVKKVENEKKSLMKES